MNQSQKGKKDSKKKPVSFKKWLQTKRLVLLVILLLFICCGFFLPEFALHYHARQQINQMEKIKQSDNLTNQSIIKNASSQLSDYERIQLISGAWESEIAATSEEEASLNKSNALSLVKSSIYDLYSSGHYPVNLNSGFGNWYTWEADFLKATDSHFHSYAAYFWRFRFTRYDGNETHTIYMMENGTLLQAATNATMENSKEFSKEEDAPKVSFVPITKDTLPALPMYEGEQRPAEELISGYVTLTENITLTTMEEVNALITEKQNYSYMLVYEAQGQGGFTYCQIPYSTAKNVEAGR